LNFGLYGRRLSLKEAHVISRIEVEKLPELDPSLYLTSDEAIAAYLTDVMQANDAKLLAAAIGDIAKARGMDQLAKAAGLSRNALHEALRPDSTLQFDTISRVVAGMGLRLVAKPARPDGLTFPD
jgi:probable addiction module antidote protein